VVDVHCHIFTPEATELIHEHYSPQDVVGNDPYEQYLGEGSRTTNRTLIPGLRPKMTEPAQRLEDMDRMGVDIQLLATFVSQYYYWVDGDLGEQVARLQNDRLAEMRAADLRRFAALGTLPMQDSTRAVAELERIIVHLGFKGVQIGSNIAGRDLDDARFAPFFARAEELGAVVLIHPNGFTHGERFRDYFMVNVVGNPMDSTLALTRLLFSGVLADHPGLKLCVVHGGGYLPGYSARMDHAWEVRPECRERIAEPPSTYLKRVYFDTMVFSPEILGSLIRFAGSDHVMLGTDYPFDMGEDDPLALVGRVQGVSEADLERVRGSNAVELFGLG
jgi:aminocarboxymuconate-semialdehyde decarboxylase